MSKPIVASGDVLEVDEGDEDEGAGGDDQHEDAPVPDVFGHQLTLVCWPVLRQFYPLFKRLKSQHSCCIT